MFMHFILLKETTHTHTHTHTHTFDLVDRNFVSEFSAEAFVHYRLDGIFL